MECQFEENFEKNMKETIAYFYNEHYGNYFGVSSYQLDQNGNHLCSIPTGIYCEKCLKNSGLPYMGVKKPYVRPIEVKEKMKIVKK